MICERAHEMLALDLYGELDLGERASLAEHVAACAACRAFRADLANGLGALADDRSEFVGSIGEPTDGHGESAGAAPMSSFGMRGADLVAAREDDLPTGWHAALARAVITESLRSDALGTDARRNEARLLSHGHSPLLVAALGFAAGVLLTVSIVFLQRRPESSIATPLAPTPETPVARASGPTWIESSSPPPPTTTTGPLALAASYLDQSRSR